MTKSTYLVDGEVVTWQELIGRAQKDGYESPDNFYTTSKAADILREAGHTVAPHTRE